MNGKKLLLMGSSTYKAEELPNEVKARIDEAIGDGLTIVVGEAAGACRLYQDYLKFKGYRNVLVGHAVSLRYNVGSARVPDERQNNYECADALLAINQNILLDTAKLSWLENNRAHEVGHLLTLSPFEPLFI